MSFSSDVKNELCQTVIDADKKYICLYSILLFCTKLDINGTILQTENSSTANIFISLLSEVLGVHCNMSVKTKKNGIDLHVISINHEDCKKMFKFYKIDEERPRVIDFGKINNNNFYVFIAGAFITCGSITDPNKEYHLEFSLFDYGISNEFQVLLSSYGISTKITTRRNFPVIYIKESENIEDILTLMGAVSSSLEIMNIKILKDIRNKANRIANCDNANIDRIISAALSQVEDIELIERTKGLDYLPNDLKELALIRLENVDVSLKELGQMLSKPLGRSGVNHRLKRIQQIAAEIRAST